MQRPIEEIVQWNLKKIDSDICQFRLQLNEIYSKTRERHLDVSKASPILNNIMITVDSLETDAQKLLQRCQKSDKAKPQEDKSKTSSGEQKTRHGTYSPYDRLFDPSQTVDLNQMPFNIGQRLKKVEDVIFSQNLEQRLETVENQQSSNLHRLEGMDKFKLPHDLPERVTKLEEQTYPHIWDRLDSVDAQMKGMAKAVFGQEVPRLEGNQNVCHQVSSLKTTLAESHSRLLKVEEKVNAHANQDKQTTNILHVSVLVFLIVIFYIIHNVKEY